jgi:hypothetical protein
MEKISSHIIPIFEKLELNCSEKKSEQNKIAIQLLAYNNPDGTIRWIFPSSSKNPLMLKFYGVIGWKSKLFSLAIQLIFLFGLKKIIAKQSQELFFSEAEFEKYKNQLGFEWAVFTGTPGKLRKALAYVSKNEERLFLKIPRTEAAKEIVNHEAFFLKQHNQFSFQHTKVPQEKSTQNYLQQSDLSAECSSRSSTWTITHQQSAEEIFSFTKKKIKISETDFWKKIEANISELKNHPPHPSVSSWNSIVEELVTLKGKIDVNENIFTSIAHTDLTPWNCFCDDKKLYIYDWELALSDAPALYDLFHFHLQGNCLLGNQPFEMVKQKLQVTIQQKSIQHFVADNSIDMALHLKLYLLYHVTNSMCWYAVQPNLHLQVHWLMKLWENYLDKFSHECTN